MIALADADPRDMLDDYIEAHLHGPLRLDRDVEAVVLDPAYRGTDTEAAAATLPVPVEWRHGFRLSVEELAQQAGYRGASVVAAGRAIAQDGWLDARVIGQAVRTGHDDGQVMKRVWHCVARFGCPVE